MSAATFLRLIFNTFFSKLILVSGLDEWLVSVNNSDSYFDLRCKCLLYAVYTYKCLRDDIKFVLYRSMKALKTGIACKIIKSNNQPPYNLQTDIHVDIVLNYCLFQKHVCKLMDPDAAASSLYIKSQVKVLMVVRSWKKKNPKKTHDNVWLV